MVWLGLLGIAWAQVPAGLRPVAASVDAPGRYQAWRTAQGLPPAQLHCEPLWPEVSLLCFRVWEDGRRRWVEQADLGRWGVSAEALRAAVEQASAAPIEGAQPVSIEGMSERYLQLVDGDGWAVAGLLRPELLAQRLGGGPLRVAMPSQGVLVAWRPAGLEVDKVMAVGVQELYASQPDALSPRVFLWSGTAWRPFGQAVPRQADTP